MIPSETSKLHKFFGKGRFLYYKKGETILRPGDIPQGAFFLKKGYVRLYSICESGKELTLIIFKPEDFFPMMWTFNSSPNMYYLESITTVEVWRAPKDKFLQFVKSNPDALFELIGKILVRLGGLLNRMEYLAFGNASQKVASILMICAERFGEKQDNSAIIHIPLTHKDVAMLVGMTRETVSIEIKKLERKGTISYKGRSIIVKNIRKLQKESLLNN